MRFAAATGIDVRLPWFVLLSTLFSVLAIMILSWLAGGLAGVELRGLLDGSLLLLSFAAVLMPITLPAALMVWVLARVMCWKAGLGKHAAAMIAGFLAGLGAVMIPALMSAYPATAFPAAIGLGLTAGVAGFLAAALVYSDGWGKMASGQP